MWFYCFKLFMSIVIGCMIPYAIDYYIIDILGDNNNKLFRKFKK